MKLLRSSDIGYSPLSARERQIEDGSKYDHLFPKPDLKTTLLQRDGEVEDTVKNMQQIVVDYSHQVRQLCKMLKGKTRRESVKNVFDFVYKYIKYQIEEGEKLRTPAYTWYEGQVLKRQNPDDDSIGVDCDCMSIFCGCCFREMKIPFAFRVTGYADRLGLCRGFQHVYAVAYDTDGKEIICDPVYIEFNKEKKYEIVKTYPMSLNGTDIVRLSGIDDENHHEYIEHGDGTIGELAGRKKRKARKAKRKARRKARKEARREKRAARKAIRKAKKSGDSAALKAAKERKKAAKKKLKANRGGLVRVAKKVGKAVARFTVATTMTVPRKMFQLLLRLNFRGLATKLANNQKAAERFGKVWRKLGGSTKSWQKAVEKGKNKKPLFGSKKLKGYPESQLSQLGAVLDEWGITQGYTLGDIVPERQLGELGIAATASVGAAIASAMPIIKKVLDIMKKVGEHIPETAEEYDGESISADDEQEIVDTEEEEYYESGNGSENGSEIEIENGSEYENGSGNEYGSENGSENGNENGNEYYEEGGEEYTDGEENEEYVEGLGTLLGNDVIAYEVVEVEGLGALGAGLFKKLASGVKKIVQKRKSKKAAKKAKKQTKKQTNARKTSRKQKRQTRQASRKQKRQARQATRNQKKQAKATPAPAPAPTAEEEETQQKLVAKVRQGIKKFAQSEGGREIVNTAKNIAINKGAEMMQRAAGGNSATTTPDYYEAAATTPPAPPKESFFKKHKAVAIVGGILLLTGATVGIVKLVKGKNNSSTNSGNAKLQALQLY